MLTKQLMKVWAPAALLLGGSFTMPGISLAMDSTANSDLAFDLSATPVIFAEELFGPGSDDVTFGGEGVFQVTLTVADGTGVSEGGIGRIEIGLAGGAEFGSRQLDPNDFVFTESDTDGAVVLVTLVSGGGVGDTGVSFQVEARDGGYRDGDVSDEEDEVLEQGDQFTLTIPGIRNLDMLSVSDMDSSNDDVRLRVVTRATSTTRGMNFQRLNPLTNGEDGSTITEDRLVRVANRFLVQADVGLDAFIDVDMRAEYEEGATPITSLSGDVRDGVSIGMLGVSSLTSEGVVPRDANGDRAFELVATDRVRIAVSGEFGGGSVAFIDLDRDQTVDAGEVIPLTVGGLALSGAGVTALRSGVRNVYLVADGSSSLVPAEYRATLLLEFGLETKLDEFMTTPPTRIAFANIVEDGFAYAIPNCTQMERARVRVTNETSSDVTLFISGVDQSGEELGEGLVEVDAGTVRSGQSVIAPFETLVLFTRHIEQIFGLNEGNYDLGQRCGPEETWGGRAQLTFFSSGNITVTSRIRGSDGQLNDLGGYTGLVVGDGAAGSQSVLTK